MKLLLLPREVKKVKVHRILDKKRRYVGGSCLFRTDEGDFENNQFEVSLGGHLGIYMPVELELSTWHYWKLFCWSLFGIKNHVIRDIDVTNQIMPIERE